MLMNAARAKGQRLLDQRETRGWQREHAALFFGVRATTIAQWESGRREMPGSAEVLLLILEAKREATVLAVLPGWPTQTNGQQASS